ncbi:antibiotic biosynthesis monooxygenase family protein [Undibacterium terreum]|uniref:Antibiotic biosynthesis monooxygenase n=1 Tax=Undibacterium terreum TaxID=1224302 RepID=A0A916XKK0_9BURK|nr:antibiotic biosynthesis monooxygenase [Undibacterium terreum]GGC78668.1 antibiotic biosynthesis monooxygenase [Undibacterium terreum]
MIAVIFEVRPLADKRDTYLGIAASLRSTLEKMPGFISVERFQSISDPGKMLSLSFWEDEESVKGWRNLELHRDAQARGRESVFEDYRLRVAGVLRDYGMHERREQAPADSPFAEGQR